MKILTTIKKWYKAIVTAYRNQGKTALELKIEEAEQKHRETGKRYHVVPNTKDKLVVLDNSLIDAYNQRAKRMGGKKITIVDLLKMARYSTK